MGMRAAADNHDKLLRELNEERVATLTRISRTLESLIGELRLAQERIPHLADAERRAAIAEYRAVRERATKYRWYLEVQREALGLRHHHGLDRFYQIPAAIDPDAAGGTHNPADLGHKPADPGHTP